MSSSDASRTQSTQVSTITPFVLHILTYTQAKSGSDMSSSGFAARAQSAAATNADDSSGGNNPCGTGSGAAGDRGNNKN